MQQGIQHLLCTEKFLRHDYVGEKGNIQGGSGILCISQNDALGVPRLESHEKLITQIEVFPECIAKWLLLCDVDRKMWSGSLDSMFLNS